MELPIRRKEGTYDLALVNGTGAQILGASGTAKLVNHNVTLRTDLRADLDVGAVRLGAYVVALRETRPGMDPQSGPNVSTTQ
jgi:hypothetical protein